MTLTIIESSGVKVTLDEQQSSVLLRALKGDKDPRVSGCIYCNSAVLASEPFNDVLDELSVAAAIDSDVLSSIMELVEECEEVHVYLWEDNECIHNLWRDPLAAEWSAVTGEKRLHR